MEETEVKETNEATETPSGGEVAPEEQTAKEQETPSGADDGKDAPTDAPKKEEEVKPKEEKAKEEEKIEKNVKDNNSEPIQDWSKTDIVFPKDFKVNQESYASFGKVAVKAGLTQAQAQALVDWQIQEISEAKQALLEAGTEELQKEWGTKYEANQKAALGFVQRIDRLVGNEEFSKALNASGAAMHPGIVKGLYKMSEIISEDSIGAGAGAGSVQKESAYDGIVNALNEQRQRAKK